MIPETTETPQKADCPSASCSAVSLALENEIEFSKATAYHCGLENLDQLFQFWHGRANGLTAALNVIKQNEKMSD